ncbi:DUF222 domain-containing protein [Streptomyces gobiensis]|uniref:DUF222 domain-containing protein n=1 Tax=Streptomyces gobiensis TaxID=2875706 RepID=UPI001E4E3253|nr:DUF222 domain-containing protein [Streptomyces gobiensis]UGY93317.1 13E12 repeat family protein [Streptomyces gobiensis]
MGAVAVGVADPETADDWAAYLAVMPVGAETAAMLPILQTGQLSGAGRIDALRAFERHAEWIQAQQVRVLAQLEDDPLPCIPGRRDERADYETTVEHVACALRLSHTSAASRLRDARELTGIFDRTLNLLEEGKIHYMQAHAVVDTTANCTEEAARRVETLALPLMPEQSVSATRKALRRAVLKADPEGADQRHQRAREDRAVSHTPAEEGMAWWNAYLPAEDVARMDAAIDTHAQAIKTEDDERTLDQRRADALVDLVNRNTQTPGDLVQLNRTAPTGRSAPLLQITVSFDTLIGASNDPAELKGYGPITAGQARALAHEPGSI